MKCTPTLLPVLLYQTNPTSSFTLPKSRRIFNWSLHAKTNNIAKSHERDTSRRTFLSTAATAALIPLTCNAQDDLSTLGSWVDSPPPSSLSVNQAVIPITFVTYLTRFIIQYDESALSWWRGTVESYSLLDDEEARRRECRDFGSLACSVYRGLVDFIGGSSSVRERYGLLFGLLFEKYSNRDGAERHLGILFSMLPREFQPVDVLRNRFGTTADSLDTTQSSTVLKEDQITSFERDISLLLPANYKAEYNPATKSYSISPPLQLFEEEQGGIINTIFGPLSTQPLTRQMPNLGKDYYTLLGISGGIGCALTHSLVIPLDVVKTRMQTNPGEYNGVFDGAIKISKNEGLNSLLLGTQATIVGYLWYGVSVYPSYSFFKNSITNLLPSAFAMAHVNDVALVAGAIASIIASLGLTPIEAARIRAVAEPNVYKPLGLLGTLGVIAQEEENLGWKNLYAGLPSLMTRQVIFGSVKFLAFERVSETIFTVWPVLRDDIATSLGVSLVAGGMAGALSSVVSQPADSVLTYVTKQSAGGNLGVVDGAIMMVQKDGVGSLFRGLGSRCVWAGCIIAGQFLLYDVFRGLFGITGDDLNQVFEIILLPQQ